MPSAVLKIIADTTTDIATPSVGWIALTSDSMGSSSLPTVRTFRNSATTASTSRTRKHRPPSSPPRPAARVLNTLPPMTMAIETAVTTHSPT